MDVITHKTNDSTAFAAQKTFLEGGKNFIILIKQWMKTLSLSGKTRLRSIGTLNYTILNIILVKVFTPEEIK